MPNPPAGLAQDGDEAIGQWIEAAAAWLDVEAEPVNAFYTEIGPLLLGAGPALLRLPCDGEPCFLALLGGRRRAVSVLGPDLRVYPVPLDLIRAGLCQRLEARFAADVDRLLDAAGIPARRRARARQAILREWLSEARIGGGWLLRLPPDARSWRLARHTHVVRRVLALLAVYAVQYLLVLLSWWILGRGALQGVLDRGWLFGWVLLLFTQVPLGLLSTWLAGLLAIDVGGLLKQRLLAGALRLDTEQIRHQGVGQLLGRVFESEAVEALALSSGFTGLLAGIELIMAAVVLRLGVGGWLHVGLLLGWLALTFLVGLRYYHYRRRWTEGGRPADLLAGLRVGRLGMTHDLIERMVGHRTRLAQQARERWHVGEDEALDRYIELSRAMDQTAALMAVMSRGWLALALLGLVPALVSGRGTLGSLAVGLGGVLLAYQALRKVSMGLTQIVDAAIAWSQVAPLFHAAAQTDTPGALQLTSGPHVGGGADGQPILDAQALVFRYHERAEPVLRGCSLRIYPGDRLLLEGPSGGGKSTLAALLVGLRLPQSGLLLLHGLDRHTLGVEGWRRRVVAAPQFHENHVFAGTFAFNLLMGGQWPPRPSDLEAATAICRELGLGDLLDQMPAGMLQIVGETGWQLSHGERSRLYIARALLQGADLIVLDESFAALDPENLHRCLRCVLERAPALLVIAHP
jgi:ATP-binding cassette subfamily B protein